MVKVFLKLRDRNQSLKCSLFFLSAALFKICRFMFQRTDGDEKRMGRTAAALYVNREMLGNVYRHQEEQYVEGVDDRVLLIRIEASQFVMFKKSPQI